MSDNTKQTFWQHLDELRTALIMIIVVTGVCSVVAFFFKEQMFSLLLAPKDDDFITYRFLKGIAASFGFDPPGTFKVELINTRLAAQFMIHVQASICMGIICAAPYILYRLFAFVAPGLYDNERRYVSRMVISGYLMFMIGATVTYLLIFPLTFRFLGTYQVSGEVINMISLESYMSTLVLLALSMGIVFEMPVIAWLSGKLGIVDRRILRRYRRHAIVTILIIAAIITPTTDVLTLLIVSFPMSLLYELSIYLTPEHDSQDRVED